MLVPLTTCTSQSIQKNNHKITVIKHMIDIRERANINFILSYNSINSLQGVLMGGLEYYGKNPFHKAQTLLNMKTLVFWD